MQVAQSEAKLHSAQQHAAEYAQTDAELQRLHLLSNAQAQGIHDLESRTEELRAQRCSKANNSPTAFIGPFKLKSLITCICEQNLVLLCTHVVGHNPVFLSETEVNQYPCIRIRQFASEYHLTDRPHTMLWLTKAFALPAGTYACQIWGTIFMKEGAEMDCPLQTVHLCLLKRILGVKRTTPNWSVLRECGHEPLQFYWFCTAVRFCNALLRSNSITLSK
eukprot:1142912-Pelagomonas_calceolata.AAC.25